MVILLLCFACWAPCQVKRLWSFTEGSFCVATGAGTVTSVTQVDCTTYTVQGYMPQNDPFEVNATTVVLQLRAGVASACSGQFPEASQLQAVDHRQVFLQQ